MLLNRNATMPLILTGPSTCSLELPPDFRRAVDVVALPLDIAEYMFYPIQR
jgi:hypothetical protein